MALTTDQASGIADRTISGTMIWLISFFLGKLAVAGYLAASDVPQLSVAVIILGSAAWGYWVNRPKAIVQAAANIVNPDGTKTIIVTSAELAAATPDQANIVSNIANSVIDKNTRKILDPAPITK